MPLHLKKMKLLPALFFALLLAACGNKGTTGNDGGNPMPSTDTNTNPNPVTGSNQDTNHLDTFPKSDSLHHAHPH